MSLADFLVETGSFKKRKRVGRGIGSGKGKTSGRGVKGQKSRTGVSINGFEGGQMPIYRRLPKRGFFNVFSKKYKVINLSELQKLLDDKKLDASKLINDESLIQAGVIKNKKQMVKLLGNGDIKSKIDVSFVKVSKTAAEKIKKVGSTTSQDEK